MELESLPTYGVGRGSEKKPFTKKKGKTKEKQTNESELYVKEIRILYRSLPPSG